MLNDNNGRFTITVELSFDSCQYCTNISYVCVYVCTVCEQVVYTWTFCERLGIDYLWWQQREVVLAYSLRPGGVSPPTDQSRSARGVARSSRGSAIGPPPPVRRPPGSRPRLPTPRARATGKHARRSCLWGSTDPNKSHLDATKTLTEFIGYKVFVWMKLYHHLYSDLDEWCTAFYMETHFTPFALWLLLSSRCLSAVCYQLSTWNRTRTFDTAIKI